MVATTGGMLIGLALAYVSALFAVAWYGDRQAPAPRQGETPGRPYLYALALAVFCTSWTFYGSVGLAASRGYDFFPVYLGPIIAFVLCWRLIAHIVRVSKAQNITSVADFMSARYGRSQAVAATVTLIALAATLPYIALQLKAVVLSVGIVHGSMEFSLFGVPVDPAFLAAVLLAIFTVLFGTRHLDATEHQNGMMLAIAVESVIKLFAFLAVGLFVTLSLFGGPAGFFTRIAESGHLKSLFAQGINGPTWITVTVLSFCAILLLPRQFHVTVVENRDPREVKTARWLFPLYLVAINIFVVPIAVAGYTVTAGLPPDTYVLALPRAFNSETVTTIAFIGGLSAATAMVIVDTVALAIMITNSLVVPFLIPSRRDSDASQADSDEREQHTSAARTLLKARRIAIVAMIMAGYLFYRLLSSVDGLANIGLVSFAAIAQLAPAFFGALLWRDGTARGAVAGMISGFSTWAYTLVLPWFVSAGSVPADLLTDGPFGLAFLAPQALFGVNLDPLSHGVLWSLAVNVLTFVFVSLQHRPSQAERRLADSFRVRLREAVPAPPYIRPKQAGQVATPPADAPRISEVQDTVARYLGRERVARSFAAFEAENGRQLDADAPADADFVLFAEGLLTSAVGPASSRVIMTRLIGRGTMSHEEALQLLEKAEQGLQFNRDLLQSSLDQVQHGLAVFGADQRLVWWNRQFRDILELPAYVGRFGTHFYEILQALAHQQGVHASGAETWLRATWERLVMTRESLQLTTAAGHRVIEIRSIITEQGGLVVTCADITEQHRAQLAMQAANDQLQARMRDRKAAVEAMSRVNAALEKRVAERTDQLSHANLVLQRERQRADRANQEKTRFIAAASHDVMQPLSAARLYADRLMERTTGSTDAVTAKNIDSSLQAVEEILGALIDIARLDTGRMDPSISTFALDELLEQLKVDFTPQARERKLSLTVVPTSMWVTTDRRLLRRVLQNFVSNAIKYTRSGGVIVGARRRRHVEKVEAAPFGHVVLQVTDTGGGIPQDKQRLIFEEFQRLEGTSDVQGLGLGLSIVDRIAKMLALPVGVQSTLGKGSTFTVTVPRAADQPRVERFEAPARTVVAGDMVGLTILLIENDDAVVDAMRSLLVGWGCRVFAAKHTKEALDVLYDGRIVPDLILADYNLDQGNGIDAIQSVRLRLDLPLPAALVTADTSPNTQIEARKFDCVVLRKPVRAAALRALVHQLTVQRAAAE